MKVTVVTDDSGLVAVQQGHASEADRSVTGAVVVAGPGQTVQEIEVPEADGVEDAHELHLIVAAALR
ncbi:hypothetical protein [Kitasatospora sp. MAP5-34]|uniref:hypothetical protein n=1 Tax=Kitasatospora sp. MAP5-34 TaxID=3035102 RepID=UPI00247498CE|nr:hypothetical protein [Kitasatospora sp. MAP5-34]MDH6575386.1 hypothetical protein [Kitasatospora sp. MAP5-34]